MDRGIALSRQYGVDRLLQPIFDYVPTADSPPLAPKHITAPPARPKKKADIGDGEIVPNPKTARVQATKAAAAAKKQAELKKAAEERAREERDRKSVV